MEAATPTLEGYISTSSPLTIIIMVTNTAASAASHLVRNACVDEWWVGAGIVLERKQLRAKKQLHFKVC